MFLLFPRKMDSSQQGHDRDPQRAAKGSRNSALHDRYYRRQGQRPLETGAKPKQELMEIAGKLREFKKINTMVLDIERKGAMSFGIAKQMAQRMGSKYQKIETLKSGAIVDAVERLR